MTRTHKAAVLAAFTYVQYALAIVTGRPITVIDGSNLAPVKTIPVGQRPRGILLSKDAKSLYICASDSDHIEVLDLASDKMLRTLPSGPDPEYFALDPEGKLLYVANEDSNLVTILDVDRGEVIFAQRPASHFPDGGELFRTTSAPECNTNTGLIEEPANRQMNRALAYALQLDR